MSIVSNVIFPTGILMADGFLYIPAAGVCLLAAAGLEKLYRRGNEMGRNRAMHSAADCCHAARSLPQSRLEERYRFLQSPLPQSCSRQSEGLSCSRLDYNHAEQYAEAEAAFKHAISLAPDKLSTHGRLGDFYSPAEQI